MCIEKKCLLELRKVVDEHMASCARLCDNVHHCIEVVLTVAGILSAVRQDFVPVLGRSTPFKLVVIRTLKGSV